jgi:hypothetical protein
VLPGVRVPAKSNGLSGAKLPPAPAPEFPANWRRVGGLPPEKEGQMDRKTAISLAVMAVWILLLAEAPARAAGAGRTLKVSLNYTGAVNVDRQHPIYVLLFDADPYAAKKLVDSTSGATPPAPAAGVSHILRRLCAPHPHGTVIFKDLAASTVYAMAFVDATGAYDGHSGFPTGAPMVVYGKAPGNMEPITLEEGKTRRVALAFDDSTQIH